MQIDDPIYVAGHRGLVGSAIVRALEARGHTNIVTATSTDLDLRDQTAVRDFLQTAGPRYVFVAAAKVGGILANDTYPADFLYDNLLIEANLIREAHRANVGKLLFLGSTCIYPKDAPQPLKEEYLLTGPLEKTNEWYAVAKIAGIKLCQAYRRQHGCNFIAAMPTNIYGPGDNFDPDTSHVIPALLRKFHEAKLASAPSVSIWGTGTPRREFCHADDLARACIHLMEHYNDERIINIGVGADITIKELATLISNIVAYPGRLTFDPSKPDGTPRKLVDASRLFALGWTPQWTLSDGLADSYAWYKDLQVHHF